MLQYLIDTERTLCEGAKQRKSFRLCGLYDCEQKESILRTLGFWTHREEHVQRENLLQSEILRWRRDDPSYLEILVSTLRALIMPLLFLSVFYVTRRLRLKLANRHASRNGLDRHRNVLRQRQCYLRSLMREGNTSSSSESSDMLRPSLILNHVVYDVPINEYPGYDDLPPPYESIVQPPSYHEATATVKSNRPPETPSLDPNHSTSPTQELLNATGDGGVGEESNDEHSNSQLDSVMVDSGVDEERVRLVNPTSSPQSPTQASHNLSA
ncbi:putative membrane protein ycf78 [Orchesella cincta]|uniref:Putative membrane protein ycf78 n=1 Tax=Orchesella cincta TaxID=48709 RepID=A0A1D2NC40_ORCCI|nr:putative membrane protein ycf78 [Orchesella cincta]